MQHDGEQSSLQIRSSQVNMLAEIHSNRQYKIYKAMVNQEIVEVIAVPTTSRQQRINLVNEFIQLMQISSTYLQELKCFYEESDEIGMILEFMPNHSLPQVIDARQSFDDIKLLSIAVDIANGLVHLQKCGVVHQRFSSHEILFDSDYRPKISGLLTSHIRDEEGRILDSDVRYFAPELLETGAIPTFLSNIYALGTIYWELFHWKIIFVGCNTFRIIDRIQNLEFPKINLPNRLESIIQGCWKSEPRERASLECILEALKLDGRIENSNQNVHQSLRDQSQNNQNYTSEILNSQQDGKVEASLNSLYAQIKKKTDVRDLQKLESKQADIASKELDPYSHSFSDFSSNRCPPKRNLFTRPSILANPLEIDLSSTNVFDSYLSSSDVILDSSNAQAEQLNCKSNTFILRSEMQFLDSEKFGMHIFFT
jgi:hypothetical protein